MASGKKDGWGSSLGVILAVTGSAGADRRDCAVRTADTPPVNEHVPRNGFRRLGNQGGCVDSCLPGNVCRRASAPIGIHLGIGLRIPREKCRVLLSR